MEFGLIALIITVIITSYTLIKYFSEDKRKFEEFQKKEWGESSPSHQVAQTSSTRQLQGFYLDIYSQCAKHINDYENKHNVGVATPYLPKIKTFLLKYNNKPDSGNADQVALTILWNFTSDALKCGTYHFHIGSLTPEGREVLAFAQHCLDTALQKGYITKQDADEANHALMQSIKEAG